MPNTVRATNLTITKSLNKFFIAKDTFRKQDGSQGNIFYKVWWSFPVQEGSTVNVLGSASAIVNNYEKDGVPQVIGQLVINATDVQVVPPATPIKSSTDWETF